MNDDTEKELARLRRLTKRLHLPPAGYDCIVKYAREYKDGFMSGMLHESAESAWRWVKADPSRYRGVSPVLVLIRKPRRK